MIFLDCRPIYPTIRDKIHGFTSTERLHIVGAANLMSISKMSKDVMREK
jgi:hypothetical protein